MKTKKNDVIISAIWSLFGFILSYSAYAKGNLGISILGGLIGAFWLYKLRVALQDKKEKQ